MARSDIAHMIMCMLSGISETKSQKLSWAVCRLREIAIRLLFRGVNQIRELDRILDEEHRDVVAHDIPVALFGVELHREAAHIARQIGGAFIAGHGGETHEGRRLLARPLEQIGRGDVRKRLVVFEVSVGAISARMHHAFRNPLMIEMEDLLAKMKILEGGGPSRADPERILIVGNRRTLLRGQEPGHPRRMSGAVLRRLPARARSLLLLCFLCFMCPFPIHRRQILHCHEWRTLNLRRGSAATGGPITPGTRTRACRDGGSHFDASGRPNRRSSFPRSPGKSAPQPGAGACIPRASQQGAPVPRSSCAGQ